MVDRTASVCLRYQDDHRHLHPRHRQHARLRHCRARSDLFLNGLLTKSSGSTARALIFSSICRTFRSGGTRIRTGDTMIFRHMQKPLGMRETRVSKRISVQRVPAGSVPTVDTTFATSRGTGSRTRKSARLTHQLGYSRPPLSSLPEPRTAVPARNVGLRFEPPAPGLPLRCGTSRPSRPKRRAPRSPWWPGRGGVSLTPSRGAGRSRAPGERAEEPVAEHPTQVEAVEVDRQPKREP